MINRFRTRCTVCEHRNTLRITLGTEGRQEHTFACAGCGIPVRVAVEIDFENRIPIKGFSDLAKSGFPKELLTSPRSKFVSLENCELCEEEGTITNLDPNFLVPSEMLHQDRVFTWMGESQRIGMIKAEPGEPVSRYSDIIAGIGGIRQLRYAITFFTKAWTLQTKNQIELSDKVLKEFASLAQLPEITVTQLALILASTFLGRTRTAENNELGQEARSCRAANETEYRRLQAWFRAQCFVDAITRQAGIFEEYAKCYDQLSQTLIYAIRDTPLSGNVVASSKDLRAVRMFYGNCFEELSAALYLPACLNNIKHGRSFDQFQTMTLKTYMTIKKSSRANPFADNAGFAGLSNEFDTVIRNASHHAAIRMNSKNPESIEYRSGDTGTWKAMAYSEYLLRCNRIMLCAMRLLLLQVAVADDLI